MKRSSSRYADPRARAAGFSLLELMMALTLTLLIGAAALTLALAGRNAYEVDQVRIGINRSLRAAGDFLVADVHQAGERLPSDFPAIEIIDGASGAPDELVVRRNLLQSVLRVCSDTAGSDATIEVAWKPIHPSAPPPAGCAPLPDDDSDGWPDDIQTWKELRVAAGGVVSAYIYNPVTEQGEPFEYDLELSEPNAFIIRRLSGSGDWTYSYTVPEQVRLYILEERRYRLVDGVLELVLNGDTGNPDLLVDRISDFQVRATVGASTFDSFVAADGWYDWAGLRNLQISIDGRAPFRLRHINRQWSTRVLPRNVLSM